MSKRMVAQLTIHGIDATIVVDGVTYSPDVLQDMVNQARVGLTEAVSLAEQYEVTPTNPWIPLGEGITPEQLQEMLGEADADDAAE